MKLPPLLLAIASAADLFASASWFRGRSESNWTVGQTVSTTSGPVTGHAAANQGQVSEYLGIPFARAPVGDLRWEAPVVFNGTTEISGASFVGFCFLCSSVLFWRWGGGRGPLRFPRGREM
jgi:cholinesterase